MRFSDANIKVANVASVMSPVSVSVGMTVNMHFMLDVITLVSLCFITFLGFATVQVKDAVAVSVAHVVDVSHPPLGTHPIYLPML